MSPNMEPKLDNLKLDVGSTTAYDYIHAKLQSDVAPMSTRLTTLPTSIAITGLEKHRRLIIDAELNPKTIEDSDTFEAAHHALKEFRDQQKCSLEMLINGPDGVLEMLNRCLAALEEAETEIATLRSTEGRRAFGPGKRMGIFRKEKEELEGEVEKLRDEISVLRAKTGIEEDGAWGECEEAENDTLEHEELPYCPKEIGSVLEVAKEVAIQERVGNKQLGGKVTPIHNAGNDFTQEHPAAIGISKLKHENEYLKKMLDQIRDATIDMMVSMVRLTDTVSGRQNRRDSISPSEDASKASQGNEAERVNNESPSSTTATATYADNDPRSPISRLPQVDLMTTSELSRIRSQNSLFMDRLQYFEERLAQLRQRRTNMADTDAIDREIVEVERELRQWCSRGPDLSSSPMSSRRNSLQDAYPDIELSSLLRGLNGAGQASQTTSTTENTRAKEDKEEEIDATGLDEADIAKVMRGAECTRNRAIKALRGSDGDIPFAVLDILQLGEENTGDSTPSESNIRTVMSLARVGRAKATQALKDTDGDIDTAVDILRPGEVKADGADASGPASGFTQFLRTERDIRAVLSQAGVSRKRTVEAWRDSGWDVEGAVLDMPHEVGED